jgi:hypothetical protein
MLTLGQEQNDDRSIVDHPMHSLKLPLPWQHHIRMPLIVHAVKERAHRFAEQFH